MQEAAAQAAAIVQMPIDIHVVDESESPASNPPLQKYQDQAQMAKGTSSSKKHRGSKKNFGSQNSQITFAPPEGFTSQFQ